MSANVVDGDGNSYKLIFALRMTKSGKTVGFHCNSEANTFKDAFRANFQNGVTPAFANKELDTEHSIPSLYATEQTTRMP